MQAISYRTLEQIISEGSVSCLAREGNSEKLSLEVRAIKKKMVVLPTARESEALPEIILLRDFANRLLGEETRRLRQEWAEDEQLERAFIEDLFEPVCVDIIKAKIYTNKEIIRVADALFANLVAFATQQLARQKPYFNKLINVIIDKAADYYKTNGKETTLYSYPFGELLEPDESARRWVDALERGALVDCLKTYAGKKNWSRAVVELRDSIVMRVRFVNDQHDTYIQNRYFEVAPLGSRETDFEWREGLKVGDLVDFYSFRSDWALYKIIRISEDQNPAGEPVRTLEIQREQAKAQTRGYEAESQPQQAGQVFGPLPNPLRTANYPENSYTNNYYPSLTGYGNDTGYSASSRYDYLDNQTITVKAHSPALATPGKFSARSGGQIDDSDDSLFLSGEKKPRFAILRTSTNNGSSSIYLVKYINAFGDHGGFDFILSALEGKVAVSQETMGQLVRMIQNASENLVEPFVKQHGEKMLTAISSFILDNAEKNLRNLSQQNLMNVIDSISSLAQRIYAAKRARTSSQQLVVRLAILCLKSDILEKQFFGARQLLGIEARTREPDGEISRASLAEALEREGIFEKIVKGHPGLISKGAGVLKLLTSEERITEAQLTVLWEQIGKTDADSRAALLGVVREVMPEFSRDQLRFFARKMLETADEISAETFELLCTLRKTGWSKFADAEVVSLVNDVFWQILQSEREMKKELSKEVMQNFIKSLDADSAHLYVTRVVDNYLENRNKLRNLKLLRSIMKHSETLCGHVVEIMRERQIVEQCMREIVELLRSKIRREPGPEPGEARPGSLRRGEESAAEELHAEPLTAEERFQVVLRLKLFKGLLKQEGGSEGLFTFEHFEQIWEVVFATASGESFIHDFIKDYVTAEHHFLASGAKFKAFFSRNYKKLLSPTKHEFFKFFMLIFHKVNVLEGGFVRRKVKFETQGFIAIKSNMRTVTSLAKPTEQLFGIDAFWELFNNSAVFGLFAQLANYLTKVYLPPEFFENENPELYAAERRKLIDRAVALFLEDAPVKGVKAGLLLTRIVKAEEKHGSGPLVSLSALKEGERLILNIEKDTKYLKERTKINISDNQTIYELKELVSREYRLTVDSVVLVRENEEEVPSSENPTTLETLGVRMRDLLVVREAEVPEVVEVGVLNDNGQDFSEQTYAVFHEIFTDYSADSHMTREHLAKFTSYATDGSYCGVNDERIVGVFEKYDQEKRGYIEEKDFVDFYRNAAVANDSRLRTVRQNLQSLGYGRDLRLKRGSYAGTGGSSFKVLLRFELCNNDQFGAQLLKYIEQGDRALGQQHAQGEGSSLETLGKLTELLSPQAARVRSLLADPLKTLQSDKHPYAWRTDLVILHALIFRNEAVCKLLEALEIEFGEEQYQALLAKVVDAGFLAHLVETIAGLQRQLGAGSGAYEYMVAGMRIVEKLVKVAVGVSDPELVSDLRNFLSFFIKQKKKISEKAQTESPAKREEEEKKDKVLKHFSEKDKDKDKDKEPEEGTSEEEQLRTARAAVGGTALIPRLLEQLNYAALNETLAELLRALSEVRGELNKFQKAVLKSTMTVFISSLRLRETELAALLARQDFQRLIFSGLAHEKGLVRLYYKNFYAFLTANSSDVRVKIEFLKILINNITSQASEDFHSLIELACNILGEIGELKAASAAQAEALHAELNFNELFANFANKLLAHASAETAFDDREDSLLIGYLAFMEKIVKADERVLSEFDPEKKKALVLFLFRSCLFELGKNGFAFQNIKCKSRKSRTAAINLLVQLLRGDVRNTINLIVAGLLPLAKNLPDLQAQAFGLSIDTDRKSQLGFLGLKNLGCVCYMIAMLQQFYCTPAFRNGILMADDKKPPVLTEVRSRLVDDNLFHQLQKMFAYLDCSERRDFNPTEFCLSYKDHSGQPVNVMVQQDADEFLKVIFDKLEDALKRGPFIGILNSVFGGKICNVIVCKGCGYEKVNEEGLYNLSLEVKGMTTLKDSFEKFVEEEIISEFMCDKCKKKCDISKKALLKALPNVLIVYLKKMVFDVDVLMNIKIHSRFEFPMDINLKKYMHFSKEADKVGSPEEADELILGESKAEPPAPPKDDTKMEQETPEPKPDDQDYDYRLVGVVIHKGNAEYGHYTSLINVNRNDPRRANITKDLWLEFDDFRVSKFDMAHFQEECFGTNEDKEFPGNLLGAENHVSKSAYILIYDKIKKSPITFPFTPETLGEKERILAGLKDPAAIEVGADYLKTDFYNLKQTLPELSAPEIEKDNCALVLEQQLLSGSFTNSLADIFSNIDLTISYELASGSANESLALKKAYAEAVLQTLPNFLFKIYCVSNDNYRIGKIVRTIESALNFLTLAKFIGGNKIAMANTEQTILNFYITNVYQNLKPILHALTNSSDQFIKTALSDLLVAVFGSLVKNFQIQNFTADPALDVDQSTPTKTAAEVYLLKTLAVLLGFLPGMEANQLQLRKLTGVFQVTQRLAEQNTVVRAYLLHQNIMHKLFDVYQNIDCTRTAQLEKALSPLLSLMHALMVQLQVAMNLRDENFVQLHTYYNYFLRSDFFAKMLKEDYLFNNFEAPKALVVTMATGNQGLSDQITFHCLKGVTSTSELDALGFLEAIRALLSIKDSLAEHRIKTIFGVPRLGEQAVTADAGEKLYIYGLCKESSLKKAICGYVSLFGGDRGLLEILFSTKEISENSCMLLIYYICELAEQFPAVLYYLASVAPPNYLTAAYYDWFRSYSEHHLRYLSASYTSYKPEVTLIYFNSLPEKLDTLEKKLAAQLQSLGVDLPKNRRLFSANQNVYSSYGSSSQTGARETGEPVELFALRPNFIIGRTNRIAALANHDLEKDNFGALRFKAHLVNVALMESRPTGAANLSIPTSFLTYDNYINKSSVTGADYVRFFGIREDYIYEGDQNEETGLQPILDLEDPSSPHEERVKPSTQRKPKARKSSEGLESPLFINRDYILRLSLSNKTDENYFVKLRVLGPENANFDCSEFIVPVRSRKQNFTVQNVTLSDVNGSFAGLKVEISFKKVDQLNMRTFSHDGFTDPTEVFAFPENK